MKHEIGEQWVEVIDGQEHMVKAVEKNGKCTGCIYLYQQDRCHAVCRHTSAWTSVECEYKVIDLGILNNYGMLPCPFCGEYPGKRVGYDNWKCGCKIGAIATWQEAVDNWNRRA